MSGPRSTAEWTADDLITSAWNPERHELLLPVLRRELDDLDTVPDPGRHPWYLSIDFKLRRSHVTCRVRGHDAIDYVIDRMYADAPEWESSVNVHVIPAARPRPPGNVDNWLRIDLDPAMNVGAIKCNLIRGDNPGVWFTWGSPNASHQLTWDSHDASNCVFPTNAAVRYEAIRQAIHEFYDLDGGGLPTCLDWQEAAEDRWLASGATPRLRLNAVATAYSER